MESLAVRYLENIKRAKELYRSYQPDDIGKNERIKAIQDHAIQVYEKCFFAEIFRISITS